MLLPQAAVTEEDAGVVAEHQCHDVAQLDAAYAEQRHAPVVRVRGTTNAAAAGPAHGLPHPRSEPVLFDERLLKPELLATIRRRRRTSRESSRRRRGGSRLRRAGDRW